MVKSKDVEINLSGKIEVCERVIMELYQRDERKVTMGEELCSLVRYKLAKTWWSIN